MKSCYIIPKGFLPESNTYTRIKKKWKMKTQSCW
jgi:hypothetical protein